MSGRFTVWGVDRAGVPWDIESFDSPLHALRRLHVEESATRGYTYEVNGVRFHRSWAGITFGITDSEGTDGGDMNTDAIDMDYCDANYTGERCYTKLDSEGLCAFRGFHEGECE